MATTESVTEEDMMKSLNAAIHRTINEGLEKAVAEAVANYEQELRKRIPEIAMRLASFYQIEFDRQQVHIKIDMKELKK